MTSENPLTGPSEPELSPFSPPTPAPAPAPMPAPNPVGSTPPAPSRLTISGFTPLDAAPAPTIQDPFADTFEAPTRTPQAPRRKRGWLIVLVTALITALILGGVLLGAWRFARHLIPGNAPAITPPTQPAPAPVQPRSDGLPQWERVAAAVAPSVVTIHVTNGNKSGVGSGVIYSSEGLIITNHHVISDAQGEGGEIRVTLSDYRVYKARIVGTDPTSDLAVLQLENPPVDLPAASFGNSSNLIVGQPVMAIGAPLGLSDTVTTGIVSALDRPVEVTAERQTDPSDPFGQFDSQQAAETIITNAIQVDAPINPGNSGGPLFDAQGQVIGINSSIASIAQVGTDQAGSIGLGFAIPIDLVRSVADQLITKGKVDHAILGVSIGSVVLDVNGTSHLGALVSEVVPGGAADQAGIREKDLITHVNGKRTPSAKSLQGTIRQFTAGSEVTVTVVRNGETLDITTTLQLKQ